MVERRWSGTYENEGLEGEEGGVMLWSVVWSIDEFHR